MIFLDTETVKLAGFVDKDSGKPVEEPIKEWVVWFRTPGGLCENLSEAKEYCDRCDFPYTVIIPVAVATTETTYECFL